MIEGMFITVNGKKRLYLGYLPDPAILIDNRIDKNSIEFFKVDAVFSLYIGEPEPIHTPDEREKTEI